MYTSTPVTEDELPENLGRYRVLNRIGAGGMAEVFLVKSTGAEGIEKILVAKRILPSFARSAKFLSMFVDEAKVAMRLNHPNIVQVYAFDQERDQFLLAMEFVDGLDLGRLISAARRKGVSMPYGIAAYVVMEIAKGLDYAHKRKDENGEPMEIVHRDVSPQNVLLTYEGVVKVADFGIAKARLVSEETGIIKGKFGYMSPEQARGERVDRRSDVYALGVLLAELLMGRKMYQGREGLEVLEAVRSGEITTPREVDPKVPSDLDSIVRRAISFDREERYQTARSLAGALGQLLHGLDDVYDGEALERFIADVAPRERTSPEIRAANRTSGASRTGESSGMEHRPRVRERRHVVLLEVKLHGGTGRVEGATVALGVEAQDVLGAIAFKSDAVILWPSGKSGSRMQFILGLGKPTVNDSLEAIRLAMDVLEALNGLSADMMQAVTASIAVSRGIVSADRDSSGRLKGFVPVDNVCVIGERLMNEAEPGQILAAGAVFRQARRIYSFDAEPVVVAVGDESSKRTQDVRAYRLTGRLTREERAAEVKQSNESFALVGRDHEIQAITGAFTEAEATGRNTYVAVEGELGVGKTALVTAAVVSLGSRARTLRTECGFGASEIPFAATAELIREACGIADGASQDEAQRLLKNTLRDVVPKRHLRRVAFEGLAPLISKVHREPNREGVGEDRLRIIMHAVEILMRGLAKQGTLIIWVDAMQWIDPPSLETLRAMIQRQYQTPILIILSTRTEPRLESLLSGIPRLELGELDQAGRSALIRDRLGGVSVAADVERAIIDRAGGNPYFILEIVDALRERGAIREVESDGEMRVERDLDVPIALPTTLEDVIAVRLGELPEEERSVLRWLAIVGHGMRAKDVSGLIGENVESLLASLQKQELVEQREAGGLCLASAVVRHVTYETTEAEDRAEMHRRVADYLTKGENPRAARIAHHLERANDGAAAANAYLEAAEAARNSYSNREALKFFQRALSLLPSGSHRRFRAHAARENIMRGMGNRSDRRREIDRMRIYADHTGDPELIAVAYNRLARYQIEASAPDGVGGILERSLKAARESGNRAAEVEALRLSAQLACDEGEIQRSIENCNRALARAGDMPDLLPARGAVRIQLSHDYRLLGRLDEAEEASAEAVVICRRLGLRGQEAHALNALGVVLAAKGEYEDAIALIRTSISMDREIGERLYIGRKLSNIGQLYKELGDIDRSVEFLEHALMVFGAVRDDLAEADALNSLAEALVEEGEDLSRAVAFLDRAKQICDRTHDPYDGSRELIVRASVLAAQGQLDEAERCCTQAWSITKDAGIVSQGLQARADLAWVLARQGRSDEADEVARDALSGAESHEVVERVERVYISLSEAFRSLGDEGMQQKCLGAAAGLVEDRIDRIRDPEMRVLYEKTRAVTAIRDALA